MKCDFEIGVRPGVLPCKEPPVYECQCGRCASENPEDRFHACGEHRSDVAERHQSIYGFRRAVEWGQLVKPVKLDLGPPGLSSAQIERLALLSEELGEAQQAIGKILRHGLLGKHPGYPEGPNNAESLERELGDVRAATALLIVAGDLSEAEIYAGMNIKLNTVGRYLHHQGRRSE